MTRRLTTLLSALLAIILLSSGVQAALPTAASVFDAELDVSSSTVKGIFGEIVSNRQYPKGKTNVRALAPRMGAQGIDNLFVEFDRNGYPKKLTVGETKVNTSQLNRDTKNGVQLGVTWTNDHLRDLGGYYRTAAKECVSFGKRMPASCGRSLDIVLKNGKTAHFWQADSESPWQFDGSKRELAQARNRAVKMGKFFSRAASGKIPYERLIFRILFDTTPPTLTTSKVTRLCKNGKLDIVRVVSTVKLNNKLLSSKLRGSAIKSYLCRTAVRDGMSERDARRYVDELCKDVKWEDVIHRNGKVELKPEKAGNTLGTPKAVSSVSSVGKASRSVGSRGAGFAKKMSGALGKTTVFRYGGKFLGSVGTLFVLWENGNMVYNWMYKGTVSGREIAWAAGRMGVQGVVTGVAVYLAPAGPAGWAVGAAAVAAAIAVDWIWDTLHDADVEQQRIKRVSRFIQSLQSEKMNKAIAPRMEQ